MPLPEQNDPIYRYLASVNFWISQKIPGMEGHVELPFPHEMEKKRYKVFGLVTNRDVEGNELIHWPAPALRQDEKLIRHERRLGGREAASSEFGENAAWWDHDLGLHLHSA